MFKEYQKSKIEYKEGLDKRAVNLRGALSDDNEEYVEFLAEKLEQIIQRFKGLFKEFNIV